MARLRPHCRVYLTALADRLSAGEPIPDAERGARRDQVAAGHPCPDLPDDAPGESTPASSPQEPSA